MFKPSIQEAKADLVYRGSSRPAKATHKTPVSLNQNKNQNKQPNKKGKQIYSGV